MALVSKKTITAQSLQEALEKAVAEYQSLSGEGYHSVSIQGPDQRFPISYSLAKLRELHPKNHPVLIEHPDGDFSVSYAH